MAHMVEQVIKYSDGTETVISYRGKIVNGVLIPDEREKMDEETKVAEETVVATEEVAAVEETV